MHVVNFTEARNRFKEVCNRAVRDHEDVIVTRKNGESVVIISLEKYNSLQETEYLLRSPANRNRLLASLDALEKGNTFTKNLAALTDDEA